MVEFLANGTNPNMLTVWVPRGETTSKSEMMERVMMNLTGEMGIKDAVLFAHGLEEKLAEKRKHVLDVIVDPYVVKLEKACDINNSPMVQLYRSRKDGDVALLVVLSVPSKNDYHRAKASSSSAMEL